MKMTARLVIVTITYGAPFQRSKCKRIDLQRVKSYVKFICTFIASRSGSETPINKILITTTERHARIGDVADKLKLPIPICT